MDIKIALLLILSNCAISWAYPETACGSGPIHDLYVGTRRDGDRLIFSKREIMPKSLKVIKILDFEFIGEHVAFYDNITRIEVLDQKRDGSGGCASLVDGGVGHKYVKLDLRTQTGGSYDFLISIYGTVLRKKRVY
uniref:Putative conserved secreted protein n=1 Tax=Panstrongylus lignarius TaxID=156445 RepID=A0A224XNU0_9HEMI